MSSMTIGNATITTHSDHATITTGNKTITTGLGTTLTINGQNITITHDGSIHVTGAHGIQIGDGNIVMGNFNSGSVGGMTFTNNPAPTGPSTFDTIDTDMSLTGRVTAQAIAANTNVTVTGSNGSLTVEGVVDIGARVAVIGSNTTVRIGCLRPKATLHITGSKARVTVDRVQHDAAIKLSGSMSTLNAGEVEENATINTTGSMCTLNIREAQKGAIVRTIGSMCTTNIG